MVTPKKKVADAQLNFARTIRKSYLAKHYMPIPDAVYSKYNAGLLKGTLTLNGDWPVEIADGAFKEGWDVFCKDNELRENDVLIFRHGGGRNLSVEVFNNDGSGKDSSTGKKRGRGKGVVELSSDEDGEEGKGFGSIKKSLDDELVLASSNVVDVVKGIVAQLDENSDVRFTVTKVPKVGTPVGKVGTPASVAGGSGKKKLRSSTSSAAAAAAAATEVDLEVEEATPEAAPEPAAVSSPARSRKVAVNTPRSRAKRGPASSRKSAEPPKKRAKTPASSKKPAQKATPAVSKRELAAAARKRKAEAAEVLPADEAEEEVQPKKAKVEEKKEVTPKAQKEVKPKVQKEVKPKAQKKQPVKKTAATPKAKGKKAKKPEEETSLIRNARSFNRGFPSAVIVMKKSNLAPCFYLGVPTDFAKDHMPQAIKEFEMLDDANKVWTVRWLGPPKNAFSGGWCYFAQDHELALGDACVLEVMSPGRVRITTFRANGGDAATAAVSETEAATGAATAAELTVNQTEIKDVTVNQEAEASKDLPVVESVDVDGVVATITDTAAALPAPETGKHAGDAAAATPVEEPEAEGDDDDEDYNPEEDSERNKAEK